MPNRSVTLNNRPAGLMGRFGPIVSAARRYLGAFVGVASVDCAGALRHMVNLPVIAVLTAVLSGCFWMQEPLPGWTVVDVSFESVPRAVNRGFERDYPATRVMRVERSTFESRMSGRPKKFRLYFEGAGYVGQHATYTEGGKRVDGFDFWFLRPAPTE